MNIIYLPKKYSQSFSDYVRYVYITVNVKYRFSIIIFEKFYTSAGSENIELKLKHLKKKCLCFIFSMVNNRSSYVEKNKKKIGEEINNCKL